MSTEKYKSEKITFEESQLDDIGDINVNTTKPNFHEKMYGHQWCQEKQDWSEMKIDQEKVNQYNWIAIVNIAQQPKHQVKQHVLFLKPNIQRAARNLCFSV